MISTMPKITYTHIKKRQQERGLTDRDVCGAIDRSFSWWRGYLAGQFPMSLRSAVVLSGLLDLPLTSFWWKEEVEHRPDAVAARRAS